MATFDYVGICNDAKAIIDEFGFRMKIRRFAYVTDKLAGTVDRGVPQEQELSAVILPASQGTLEAFDVRFMNDVLESTDVRFTIISAVGATFTPAPKDEVEYWDGVWNVMGCTPLNVAGIPLIYSVGLKKP